MPNQKITSTAVHLVGMENVPSRNLTLKQKPKPLQKTSKTFFWRRFRSIGLTTSAIYQIIDSGIHQFIKKRSASNDLRPTPARVDLSKIITTETASTVKVNSNSANSVLPLFYCTSIIFLTTLSGTKHSEFKVKTSQIL